MKQSVVFFGSGWYTIPVIKRLIPHGLDLVITTEKNPDSLFLKFCSEKNIKTLSISSVSDLIHHSPSIIQHSLAVLASFGAIIPTSIIDHLPFGIINIHPSLLPKYKGPAPIQYTLLSGETVTGVSLIKLDDKFDHGPILLQKTYNLQGNETTEDLLSILFEIGGKLVEQVLLKLENSEAVEEIPQDHSKESWSEEISKRDGMIDVSSPPNQEKLSQMIRAFYPWPGVWLSANLKLQTKKVKLLPEEKIQVEGKNVMTYKDFINGYGDEGKELLQKIGLGYV